MKFNSIKLNQTNQKRENKMIETEMYTFIYG